VVADRGGTAIGAVVLPPRPDVPSQPVRLPPRPVFLAGREGLLAELDARLADDRDRPPGPRLVALCGLGGAGKTSVAVEYAHRHLAEAGVCWLLPAEDPAVLAAEFAVLAAQLGTRELVDARDPVASVHAVLARAGTGWLLIFDNAADRASLERFLPPAGNGRVLITTQSQLWPAAQALDVPVLDPEVAAAFLVNRTGDPDQAAARELAAELGGLPLALEQAAAYMQATGTPLARYLPLFRARQADLLSRGEAAGHREHTAATLGLALSRLGQDAPAATGLLRLLAFLAPEPVPLGLLLTGQHPPKWPRTKATRVVRSLLGDPLALGDAIAALRRYSLAAPAGDRAGDGRVQVHRLVQAITRAQLSLQAVPADVELPEAWPACAALLPHARAVLDLTSGGIWRIGWYLGYSGSYPAAQALFALMADAYADSEKYGPEHPATLEIRANLAHSVGEAGDAAGARDLCAALLPVCERVQGRNHPVTLNVRASLARWRGEAGDAAGARDQFAALLPVYKRILGLEHPHTLTLRANLARWTGNAGDAAGARDQTAALLPVSERVLGPEHPDILAYRSSVAGWSGQAGEAAGARDLFAALVPVYERVLGPEHPDTLTVRASLPHWRGEAGDAAGARDECAALVPVYERVLGPEHPYTLAVRASLARWTGDAGDAAGARDECAALLPVSERVLGPDHPDILSVRASLARWRGEAGDVAGARDEFAALLLIEQRVLGPEHPDTLNSGASLARWRGEAGDVAGARDQFAALLPVYERILGLEHPRTLAVRSYLARWTGDAGDAAAARDQLAALLLIDERILGPQHPDTLADRASLARWTTQANRTRLPARQNRPSDRGCGRQGSHKHDQKPRCVTRDGRDARRLAREAPAPGSCRSARRVPGRYPRILVPAGLPTQATSSIRSRSIAARSSANRIPLECRGTGLGSSHAIRLRGAVRGRPRVRGTRRPRRTARLGRRVHLGGGLGRARLGRPRRGGDGDRADQARHAADPRVAVAAVGPRLRGRHGRPAQQRPGRHVCRARRANRRLDRLRGGRGPQGPRGEAR
jgi:hypothetical protein